MASQVSQQVNYAVSYVCPQSDSVAMCNVDLVTPACSVDGAIGDREAVTWLCCSRAERDKQTDIRTGARPVSPMSNVSDDSYEDEYEKDPWFYRKY